MENNELLKRGEDLARRCENKGCLTSTGFLTPAEQYALAHDAELRFSRMVFRGGHEDFERGMAFSCRTTWRRRSLKRASISAQ